jgi:hypothetical protein
MSIGRLVEDEKISLCWYCAVGTALDAMELHEQRIA